MNRKNSELKNMARAFLLGNYKVTIAALCVTGAITMAISMIFEYVAGENSSVFLAVNILLAILDYVLNAGLMTVHLDIARRRFYRRLFHYTRRPAPNAAPPMFPEVRRGR